MIYGYILIELNSTIFPPFHTLKMESSCLKNQRFPS